MTHKKEKYEEMCCFEELDVLLLELEGSPADWTSCMKVKK
jgi:hypothetical protein